MSSRKPKVISLFSGAGGIDYGFEAAGFETAVAVEMNHDACETLRANRPWPVIERDIFDVSSAELLATAGLAAGDADVLVGGPPCQPFSKSGYWKRGDAKRLADPRADTLNAYLRVLEDTLPKAMLLENVYGIAYEGKNEGLTYLLEQIEGINRRKRVRYRPAFTVLKAADFGVPQLRERFFLIASRDGTAFTFPKATHRPRAETDEAVGQRLLPVVAPLYCTAWDALADVEPDPDEDLAVRGKWASLLPSIPEGKNYLWHTERGGGLPLFGWRRRFWNFLLKLAKDQPAWTIQAQPGPAVGPFHWDNRRLSSRELCRLQTFPDNVRILGARNAVQRQVGNAVPSLLAEVLARAIRAQLLGYATQRARPRLLPQDRSPYPPPTRRGPVPAVFRQLAGDHPAHPGTGQGYGALARHDLSPP